MFLSGIFLPKSFIKDDASLSAEKIACAKKDARAVLKDLPERFFVVALSVSSRQNEYIASTHEDGKVYVNIHTFGGLKYAQLKTTCDESAEVIFNKRFKKNQKITNFEECRDAGYAVGESYPAQCWTEDGHFYEEIDPIPTG